ncbi:MFS transporter [Pusillimonas sp.]|uniref:MFS transporter n=1 Tax=Pusillimonas sp. TaxID=3040095 RepID=UPI0037C86E07
MSSHIMESESLVDSSGNVYQGWKTTLASLVGLSLGPSVLLVFCFGTFITPLHQEFGWSIASISAGAMIISFMIMLTSIVQGRLVDRFGGRPLVLISVPLLGVSYACLHFLPNNIWVFYAAWVVIAWCGLGAWPIAYLKLTGMWFERRLGLAFGIANAGIGIGAAMMPPLAVYMIANYGWRTAYVALGLVAIVVTWPIAFFFLKDRKDSIQHKGHATAVLRGMDLKASWQTRELKIIVLAFALLGAVSTAAIVHQTRVLIDLGMTPQAAGGLQAVLGIALIFGRVCTGWLLDRIHASTIMIVLCLVAALALFGLGSGAPFNSAILCAAAIGFVVGAEFDVLSYIIPRYFGIKSFGAIYGVIFAAFQLCAALGIMAVGVSRSNFGGYSQALFALALLLVLCAFCFKALGAYRFASREPAPVAAEPAAAA